MTEQKKSFLGTYFDSDAVLRMARVIGILSWVVAAIYLFDVVLGFGVFFLQYTARPAARAWVSQIFCRTCCISLSAHCTGCCILPPCKPCPKGC